MKARRMTRRNQQRPSMLQETKLKKSIAPLGFDYAAIDRVALTRFPGTTKQVNTLQSQ